MTAERPFLHFTPPENFLNDPNGLVFSDGEYHLFYQHNLHAAVWGDVSWGHAVSRNLVTWEYLPPALREHDGMMMFSGSGVVDVDDTSGFGTGGRAPLVLVYTEHDATTGRQSQALAYSTDHGRTFTQYAGNPVIDENRPEFRDPKVFRYEPDDCWVMVVSLGADRRVRFYRSDDLKAWEATGEFGPAGARGVPNWECPDVFPLRVEGSDDTLWVLKVDVGDGGPAGGSGSQYFVGRFDGGTFHCADPPGRTRWVEFGADFYAAQTWSNVPGGALRRQGHRIWVAWMSNWRYALTTPTDPWRGMMTVPREICLRRVREDVVLVQRPAAAIVDALTRTEVTLPTSRVPQLLRARVRRRPGRAGFAFGRPGDDCIVGVDFADGEVFVDRSGLRAAGFHPDFARRHSAELPDLEDTVSLEIVIDRNSIEVFAADGEVVISDLAFFEMVPGCRLLAGTELAGLTGGTLQML